MATSAYLERVQQLQTQKQDSAAQSMGLPLNRPMNKTPAGMAGQPMPQGEQQEPQGPNMDTFFGKTFQQMEGEDKRFGTMFQDLSKLANGLRQEVDAGFMPESVAKQRIEQYVADSQKWFGQNQAGLMDNPQFSDAVEGFLAQAASQQGAEPMEGQMPQQGGM